MADWREFNDMEPLTVTVLSLYTLECILLQGCVKLNVATQYSIQFKLNSPSKHDHKSFVKNPASRHELVGKINKSSTRKRQT